MTNAYKDEGSVPEFGKNSRIQIQVRDITKDRLEQVHGG